MKEFLTVIFLITSTATIASETVELIVPFPYAGCEEPKQELLDEVKQVVSDYNIDGRFTVIVEKQMCEGGEARIPYPCNCILTVTLQESSFSFYVRHNRVRRTLNRSQRETQLEALVQNIENKDGYVWHNVRDTSLLFWKGFKVQSLFLSQKTQDYNHPKNTTLRPVQ